MPSFDKIIVVTQKTALEELIEKYNTKEQAKFYLEHLGSNFQEYQHSHDQYHTSLERLLSAIPPGVRVQQIEKSFLPNFLFVKNDLVVIIGRDGLLVNAAKYLEDQPILGVNPDPKRIDGVLLPFNLTTFSNAIKLVLAGTYVTESITMALASLSNGQQLLAVNDLFIGQKTHTSAKYIIEFHGLKESQSSSGIIVSTGAGSTGWFRSLLKGAAGLAAMYDQSIQPHKIADQYQFDRQSNTLVFTVREPFTSKTSGADILFGTISDEDELVITSQMPQNGIIFSDGVEADYLEFNSGAVATIRVADRKVRLIRNSSIRH
jgi:NAD kinase